MTPLELVLSKLRDARKSGEGWIARCPAHDDHTPSLCVNEGDAGWALVHCQAGCPPEAVVGAMGLKMADLMPKGDKMTTPKKVNRKAQIEAQYDYRDEIGNVLFQVVRYDTKAFKQRRPNGKGGWIWNIKGLRIIPYRLPELLSTDLDIPVFVVEGEKDCENLARLGIVATCNSGGAGKWTSEHSMPLRDRIVFVIPDNDNRGRTHAELVAQSLQGIAKSVRIVELPNLPEKGDVSDWIAAGGTKSDLMRLAETVPIWIPPTVLEPGPVLTCLADVEPREVSWLWMGRIPLGRLSLLVGRPGEGKSFLTIEITAHVTKGTPWPDGSDCPKGSVVLISAEDHPADTIRPRLDAHAADLRNVHLLPAVRKVDSEGHSERLITLADIDAIEATLLKLPDCKLIVVDPIGSFLGAATDAHRDNEVRTVLAPIAKLAEKYGVAVLVVAHRRKGGGNFADDLALGSRAFTGIARTVWHLSRDEENKDRRLLLPGKNNLAQEGGGLAFSIVGEPARIIWENEPVAMSADDALIAEMQMRSKSGPIADALSEAKAWLEKALADGPQLAKDLFDEWKNGQGGSERTLKRAKKDLGVKAIRKQIPGPWWWFMPGKDAMTSEVEPLGPLGPLAETMGTFPQFETIDSKGARLTALDHLPGESESLLV